ncbi:hypothetical protein Bbelb_283650 [Branchiostoma belcheri]|nr:hypothetical protein Bbelb_283650 [Branchiostoma belcheri]
MAAPAVTPLDVEMFTCPSTPLVDLIDWLCPNVDMEWQERRNVGDRHSWRCQHCRTSKSIREGSVFADFPKISLPIWMRFLLQWAEDKLVKDMKAELAPVGNISYITVVKRPNVTTLLPIIQRSVLPGSTVYSDEWAAYRNVGNLPNVTRHRTTFNPTLAHVYLSTLAVCADVPLSGKGPMGAGQSVAIHVIHVYDPHTPSTVNMSNLQQRHAGGNTPPELVRRRGKMTAERKSFVTEVRAALDRYGVEDAGHRHLHKAVDMAPPTTASLALKVRVTRLNGTLLASAEERGRQGETVTLHVHELTEEGRQHPAFGQLDAMEVKNSTQLVLIVRMKHAAGCDVMVYGRRPNDLGKTRKEATPHEEHQDYTNLTKRVVLEQVGPRLRGMQAFGSLPVGGAGLPTDASTMRTLARGGNKKKFTFNIGGRDQLATACFVDFIKAFDSGWRAVRKKSRHFKPKLKICPCSCRTRDKLYSCVMGRNKTTHTLTDVVVSVGDRLADNSGSIPGCDLLAPFGFYMCTWANLTHTHTPENSLSMLALLDAMELAETTVLGRYQRTMGSVYGYFANSSSRQARLKDMHDILDTDDVQSIHAIRWLSFSEANVALNRTLKAVMAVSQQDAETLGDVIAEGLGNAIMTYEFVGVNHLLCDVLGASPA